MNDNPPYFLEKDYKATIVDNIPFFPEASPIIQVSAADADIGENGEVFYSIRSGNENDLFRIDNRTGVLYPNGNFQGQKGQEFKLVIAVTDGSGEDLWDSPDLAGVHVLVESVNSHKPRWSPPPPLNETVHVVEEENANIVRVLKTVHAEDMDGDNENGRISYFLKVKNENVLETAEFKIDERTGELRTKVTFDRETRDHYELVIIARDHGTPVAFETLRFLNVVVDDIDDNKPMFAKTKETKSAVKFTVPEEEEPGYLVGRVEALDPDAGKLGRIFYYILQEGNEDGYFRIDRTQGNIYTKQKLDREESDPPKELYKLFVKASNNGSLICEPSYCNIDFDPNNINEDDSVIEIDITLQDINDNMLQFSNNKYYVGVPYDASVGDLIMDVTAYDPDTENGKVSYSIKSSNLFRQGETQSAGSLVPSPFKMSPGGSRLLLDSLMAEYNQQR